MHAEPAAFDHRRPAHADAGVLGRDDDVAAPEQRRVAGEAVPGRDPDERDQPGQPPEEVERAAVQPGHDRPVDIARPPSPPSASSTDGQPPSLGELEQPVLLEMVAHALGAGQDRVVVGHDHGGRPGDVADAADEPVGRRPGDQLLLRAPSLLGGENQRPVLDERAVVDEIGDVLARRPPPLLTTACHRLRPRRVEPRGVARQYLVERRPGRRDARA